MSTLHLDRVRLGEWSEELTFAVDAERTRAYAAATNDDHPLYVRGELAPVLFAGVPLGEAVTRAMDLLLPTAERRWGLHSAQDLHIHRPIVPGMVLLTRIAPIGVQVRTSGTWLVLKAETREGGGAPINEQYVTLFFKARADVPSAGEAAPDHRVPPPASADAWLVEVTQRIDDDQTSRYAAASGDHSPIHLDAEFARSVGLPGIIVHGMCTMAFVSRAVVAHACAGDPLRLRRLAVRFARPVLPGQEITTRLWAAGGDGRLRFGFDVVNAAGKAVIQDGLAEVDR